MSTPPTLYQTAHQHVPRPKHNEVKQAMTQSECYIETHREKQDEKRWSTGHTSDTSQRTMHKPHVYLRDGMKTASLAQASSVLSLGPQNNIQRGNLKGTSMQMCALVWISFHFFTMRSCSNQTEKADHLSLALGPLPEPWLFFLSQASYIPQLHSEVPHSEPLRHAEHQGKGLLWRLVPAEDSGHARKLPPTQIAGCLARNNKREEDKT